MLALENGTVSGNSAGSSGEGGGIYTMGAAAIKNSIIAGNSDLSGYRDCCRSGGALDSFGYNLVEIVGTCTFTATGDITNTSPLLGPLADNGGETLTHALMPSSPAIDQGSCSGFEADQRSRPRPVDIPGVANMDDGCDIGTYELQPAALSVIKTAESSLPAPGQRITFTVVVRNDGDLNVTKAVVFDTLPFGVTLAGTIILVPSDAGSVQMPPILASDLTITAGQGIILTFPVTVSADLTAGTAITNTAVVTGSGMLAPELGSVIITVRHCLHLPLILRNHADHRQ